MILLANQSQCNILYACKTQHIDCNVFKNLNTDLKNLYNICHAVQPGICSSELVLMQPAGPINHARWTTLANRLLMSYISMIQLTPELSRIVNYYAPVWFRIKSARFVRTPIEIPGIHAIHKLF